MKLKERLGKDLYIHSFNLEGCNGEMNVREGKKTCWDVKF